ncbi:MAG: hypothetical protein HY650_06270 [Acidobacteria bacterium]|nr:hypothetical protein [Acidobacteriota bacterium]
MMVELSQPGVNVRYGRHDRYGIPLDHPEARRFYLDHLFVPHSRREMIWAAVARASSSAGRVILIREPGRGFPPELNKQECLSHVEFLTGELEKHLRRPGTPVSGPLFALTLEDYPDSERQQKVLFLFSPSSSMPCAIAKVTAQSRHAVTLKAEYRTLQTLQVELDRDLRATIPRPLGYFEAGSFPVLAETFLPGHSIYFDLRNSWRPHRLAPGHFRLAHDWLVRFQRAMEPEGRSLDKEMIGEYVACPLERFQRAFELSASERNLIDQVMGSARRLQGEHLSIVAHQGDFWARN